LPSRENENAQLVLGVSELLPQFKLPDQLAILVNICAFQVIKQFSPLTYHLEQPSARVMVLNMRLEMIRQSVDTGSQKCNLHFRRSGIPFGALVAGNNVRLLLYGYWHFVLVSVYVKGQDFTLKSDASSSLECSTPKFANRAPKTPDLTLKEHALGLRKPV
jgi:hypothetical protein